MDYVKRRCRVFNRIGELCQQRGMRFYYHNHYQEFQRFGDKLVYDIIMENTDPGLVYAEMDTYWIARGGQDPASFMRKYNDRLILLHQKDFPKNAGEPLCMFDGLVGREENIDFSLFMRAKNDKSFTEIGTGGTAHPGLSPGGPVLPQPGLHPPGAGRHPAGTRSSPSTPPCRRSAN